MAINQQLPNSESVGVEHNYKLHDQSAAGNAYSLFFWKKN